MSTALILDAQALSLVAAGAQGQPAGKVFTALRAAINENAAVLTPAAVLAELYRGSPHDAAIDSLLSRTPAIRIAATDRSLARIIGGLLTSAGRSSADHVDATVVATAITAGGGLILTADPDDIRAIAAGEQGIEVKTI